MAMRSQVYAWDLYKGTAVTGQPLTVQLESNTLSPIKTLDVDVGGGAIAGNYIVGERYYFENISPGSAIGHYGSITPTIVADAGGTIAAYRICLRHRYCLHDNNYREWFRIDH